MGVTASTDDCFLGLRGLRTLAARLDRQQASAIAHRASGCATRPEVKEVLLSGAARRARPRAVEARLHGRDLAVRRRAASRGGGARSPRCSTAWSSSRWAGAGAASRASSSRRIPERTRTRHDVGPGRTVPAPRDRPRGSRRPDRRSRDGLARLDAPRRFRPRPGRPPAPAGPRAPSAGVPSAMIPPRSSTITRSAKPNTTSMSCSVNSTAMPSCRARSAATCISRARDRVRHARGRLVHQQQPRLAGERERQLDALGVAVGERRAMRVGEVGAADAREQRVGAGIVQRRRERRRARGRGPHARAARARTFSRTVIDANVAATWNVRPTPRARDRVRRQAVDARAVQRDACRRPARAGR